MKVKRYLIYFFSVLFLILLIMKSDICINVVKDTLYLCYKTVIPSLFPFFILSSFMINTGFVNCAGKIAEPFAKTLFRVSGNGAVVFIMGVLCGYPTGAKMVSELYKTSQIEKNEALRLLPFCNNSGPLFIIGAVGVGMLGSVRLGTFLYIIHIASALLTGVILSFFGGKTKKTQRTQILNVNFGKALSDSVISGVSTMANVCGYIIFFSVIKVFLMPIIYKLSGDESASLYLSGLLEVTLGAFNICSASLDLEKTLILTSGILGFGGLCVFLQVWGIVSEAELSVKTYILGKLIQMAISFLLSYFYLKFVNIQPVFLNTSQIAKRYVEVLPFVALSLLFLMAYAGARRR